MIEKRATGSAKRRGIIVDGEHQTVERKVNEAESKFVCVKNDDMMGQGKENDARGKK
jgi:hypothetical protein